jgi:hypothetical protein
MPIDPTDLAKSIGGLGSLDPERGLAPTLQQIADAAKQLFAADGAGLMLIDAEVASRKLVSQRCVGAPMRSAAPFRWWDRRLRSERARPSRLR